MRQPASRQGSLSPMVERWNRFLQAADRWASRRRSTRVGRRALAGFALHDGPSVASSMAYFAILSLFQVIVLGVIVFSLLIGEGEARRILIGRLGSADPDRHRYRPRGEHRLAAGGTDPGGRSRRGAAGRPGGLRPPDPA